MKNRNGNCSVKAADVKHISTRRMETLRSMKVEFGIVCEPRKHSRMSQNQSECNERKRELGAQALRCVPSCPVGSYPNGTSCGRAPAILHFRPAKIYHNFPFSIFNFQFTSCPVGSYPNGTSCGRAPERIFILDIIANMW